MDYFSHLKPIFFAILFIISWVIFFFSLTRLVLFVLTGRYEKRWDKITLRIKAVIINAFAQKAPLRYLSSGIKHLLIFWGFILIGFETVEMWGRGFSDSFKLPIIGTTFRGYFTFLLDITKALVIFALGWSLFQRLIIRVKRLENTADAFFIISLIFILMITSLGATGAEALLENIPPKTIPVSVVFSSLLSGLTDSQLLVAKEICWWVHIITILFFLNYLPYSKHIHIITAIPNIFFKNLDRRGKLEKLDLEKFEKGEIEYYGVKRIEDFTWKQNLDFISCTECGRCSDNCPAYLTGKSLSPMHLVHKLKDRLKHDGRLALRKTGERPPIADGKIITDDELWDCTTCGVCEEICPVNIEHPRFIIDLRRNLVFENRLFGTAAKTLQRIANQGNPWGLPAEDRTNFAKNIGLRILNDGEIEETIYWVGCAGYYDPLSQRITKSMSNIMRTAGVDIPVLGSRETCTGDPARRIGEEGLFTMMAQQNLELLKGVKKIVTHCPHCYQTLKNDYKDFGANFEVIHHTELIFSLISENKIKIKDSIETIKVTYHDSCYLGRYNSIYDLPRNIISKLGLQIKEPPRKRDRGMCCGAGGGRMWMEETRGKRINVERFEQIVSLNPEIVISACPYCLIMMDDACKFKNLEEKIQTKDISEIVSQQLVT